MARPLKEEKVGVQSQTRDRETPAWRLGEAMIMEQEVKQEGCSDGRRRKTNRKGESCGGTPLQSQHPEG